ncbi:MAG: heme o synthase [Nitriliruptorales bacterium]|nr:heme o synthase [Nitriliruptorales bacterium]
MSPFIEHPGVDEGAATAAEPLHTTGRYESLSATVRRYVLATKPRIIELLLVTTVPAMVVAREGWPGTRLVAMTLLGGSLTAGSANVLNNVHDRDVDQLMGRTGRRPTARGELSVRAAVVYGIVLGIVGFAILAIEANLLAAVLAASAIGFYVFVYTMWLKRSTDQAVVIGGAAGCVPVLTGWAAVTGNLADPRPWLLFAIVFWWTPPHFWALAMKYRRDYEAAGLPMLPVTRGNVVASQHVLLYSWLLLSVVLLYISTGVGWLFIATSLGATAVWLLLAVRLRRTALAAEDPETDQPTIRAGMRLFAWSTTWLALVFVAAAVDASL